MHTSSRLLALALGSALALVPAAGAQTRADVDAPAVPGEYVVKFEKNADKEKAAKDHGGQIVDSIPALGLDVVSVPETKAENDKQANKAMARELRADARIEKAEPNFIYTQSALTNDPNVGQQYAWGIIHAGEAWTITKGSANTVIAIIDTGINRTHADLDAKIVAGYDFVQNDAAPDDGNGHGTHVAGIAAAETNNSTGGAGLCQSCRLMPVRVLDNNGSGTLANVAKGITWAADHGAKVINMSLGGGGTSTLQQAVDYAANKGVFEACAAGNDNTSSTASAYPGAYANCFAVAATTSTDARASYSNYGSWVEAAAPGSNIYSTWLNNGYNTISGTSMATPHVAGLAGLLASQGLTATQIRDRICSTSDHISGTGTYWSCGRINAAAAVGAATPPPPPPAPTALTNGGFENGTSPWTQTSSGGYSLITTTRPHTGSYSAYLGGYNNGTDAVSQAVTVPSSGTLKYWWFMTTNESSTTAAYDTFRVRVLSSSGAVLATLRTFSNLSGPNTWRQDSLSLASYAGQSVRIEFSATTDASLPTSFFVDDVSL